MDCVEILWKRHALERMLERGISRSSVKEVIRNAIIIEKYVDDRPYPSQLIYAQVEDTIVHAVVAMDPQTQECYVITAYIPTGEYFESDMITRRKK